MNYNVMARFRRLTIVVTPLFFLVLLYISPQTTHADDFSAIANAFLKELNGGQPLVSPKQRADRTRQSIINAIDESMLASELGPLDLERKEQLLQALERIDDTAFPTIELTIGSRAAFLRKMSRSSEDIAFLYASILTKAAELENDRGNIGESLRLLNNSFALFDGLLEKRKSLITYLSTDTYINTLPGVSKQLVTLVNRANGVETAPVVEQPSQLSTRPPERVIFRVVGFLVIAIVIIFVVSFLYFKKRQELLDELEEAQAREDLAQWRSQKKRRYVFSFFGLDINADKGDLRKEFIRRAKSVHPDMGGESDEGFRTLQMRYEEAQRYISKADEEEKTIPQTIRGIDYTPEE